VPARAGEYWIGKSVGMAIGVSGKTQGERGAVLEQGKPIERELAGGESHSYQLMVASGQYVFLAVDQRGINVVVKVFGPDDKKFVEVNNNYSGESEMVSLVAEASTIYRLEVRSAEKDASKGRYEIKIKELPPTTEQDKSRVQAERLSNEAMLHYREKTTDSLQNAVEKYKQSLPLWHAAKDSIREAQTLYMIGQTYIGLGEKQKALEACDQALSVARVAGNQNTE